MRYVYLIFVVMVLLFFPGCVKPGSGDNSIDGQGPCVYAADQVRIIGLTSVKPNPNSASSAVISAYVGLHDSYGSSIKGPAVFRFELYEYIPRTGDRKGKRLYSWADIDLSDVSENNIFWKDFLRAYNFTLNVGIDPDLPGTYVLQVTCVMPAGKRLTDIFYLDVKNS
ncbi:MAG: hypothetical protein K9M75_08030 [Phycisphaerae bacterium]|nr:hypothetical protein [Phycisphaerae bacterium]